MEKTLLAVPNITELMKEKIVFVKYLCFLLKKAYGPAVGYFLTVARQIPLYLLGVSCNPACYFGWKGFLYIFILFPISGSQVWANQEGEPQERLCGEREPHQHSPAERHPRDPQVQEEIQRRGSLRRIVGYFFVLSYCFKDKL